MSGRPRHYIFEASYALELQKSKNTRMKRHNKGLACHGHAAMSNTPWTSMAVTPNSYRTWTFKLRHEALPKSFVYLLPLSRLSCLDIHVSEWVSLEDYHLVCIAWATTYSRMIWL